MFIAALFIIARTWKQPRCPSANEWIRKLWYIYTMEYYSAIKAILDGRTMSHYKSIDAKGLWCWFLGSDTVLLFQGLWLDHSPVQVTPRIPPRNLSTLGDTV